MPNKGWDTNVDARYENMGGGKHSTAHDRGLKQQGDVEKVAHLTSLREQYDNGGEWNTELPESSRTVPRSPYRTGVVVDGKSGYNVAAYDGIYGP